MSSRYDPSNLECLKNILRFGREFGHLEYDITRVKFFGGCVRDLLLDRSPVDIDVYFPFEEKIRRLVSMLQNLDIVRIVDNSSENERLFSYNVLTIEIKNQHTNEWFRVDFKTCNNSMEFCDFTANNLTFNFYGEIGFRVKPTFVHMPDEVWLARCIRDVMSQKLVWMIPEYFDFNSPTLMRQLTTRFKKMIRKGFTFTGDSLSSFVLKERMTVQHLPPEVEATTCSICKDDYSEDPSKETVVLACGNSHHFHLECIEEWESHNNTCPLRCGEIRYQYIDFDLSRLSLEDNE